MCPPFGMFRLSPTSCDSDARRRVLIVEDHPDLIRLMTLLLRHHGFATQSVASGDLAHAEARSFRPDFILLDIGLPILDGYEVARLIRSDADLNNVVIIAVSAYGTNAFPERHRQADFDHHLTKPVAIDDLLPLLVSRRA
jgi:CheY-like chemotaxis protein